MLKDSPIPMYIQVEKALKKAIEEGELKPGVRIPTEVELCQQYGLSRITIRNAIQLLVDQGYLHKAQGKGTTVIGRQLKGAASILSGFTDDASRMGKKPGSRILAIGRQIPPPWVISAMYLSGKQTLSTLTRLRILDNLPIAIQICFLSPRLKIEDGELKQIESLYAFLQSKGVHIVQGEEIIQAMIVPKAYVQLLEVDPQAAVLAVKRATFDETGIPIECVEGYYRSDRYQHYSLIRRNDGTASIYNVKKP